jgi:DNA repair photolyase
MFPFITETWNPIAGGCLFDCSYCWAKKLINQYNYAKYEGEARLDSKAMKKVPNKGFIFVQDMSDISNLEAKDTVTLMEIMGKNKEAIYLLLTKNPIWYLNMMSDSVTFPDNVVFGATIETNRKILQSKAPEPFTRFWGLKRVHDWIPDAKTFISVEPIMDFSMHEMVKSILEVKPWAVAVGYDNYNNDLPEPTLLKTTALIQCLESYGITVFRKTLRDQNRASLLRMEVRIKEEQS